MEHALNAGKPVRAAMGQRWAIVALCLVVLPGCVNLSRTTEPQRIFPGPAEAPAPAAAPMTDSAQCVEGASTLTNGRIPDEITQFANVMACAYQQVPGSAGYKSWMVRFIDKGITLSNQSCELFFDDLDRRRVEASYAQTNFNVAGTTVTAVLAATTHHVRAIFNVATFVTAGNAWFENYKSNYVLTPQLRKLHDIIQTDLRDPIAVQIRTKSDAQGYRSFDDAKQDLLRYDALCSHKVIQDVVNEAVAKATLVTTAPSTDPDKLRRAEELKKELRQLAYNSAAGQFGPGEFEALYVLATTPAADRVTAATAMVSLQPQMNPAIKSLNLHTAASDAAVVSKFEMVGKLLGLESTQTVIGMRLSIAKAIEKERAKPVAGVPATTPLIKSPTLVVPLTVPFEVDASEIRRFELLKQEAQVRVPGTVSFKWEMLSPR